VCLRDRHSAAQAEGAPAHLPGIQAALGVSSGRQEIQGIPPRSDRRMASQPRAAQTMTQWLAALDPGLMIVGIALAGVALSFPFFVASLRRMRRLKLVRGTLYLLFGGVVVLLGVAAGLVATNLVTYARLTTRALGERQFAVSVQTPGGQPRHYQVRGDEWQIDARVLKWRALGTVLGFDTVYRLERLSGRYGDVQSESSSPRTVYELAADPGV